MIKADITSTVYAEHINTDYPLLDLNNDGIVNAKDYAMIIKTAAQ